MSENPLDEILTKVDDLRVKLADITTERDALIASLLKESAEYRAVSRERDALREEIKEREEQTKLAWICSSEANNAYIAMTEQCRRWRDRAEEAEALNLKTSSLLDSAISRCSFDPPETVCGVLKDIRDQLGV